jgi:Na+-driven multidrug efflux pump
LFCVSIFDAATYPISTAFTSQKKTRLLAGFTFTISLVDIVLMALCLPLWGISGLITGKVASRLFGALLGMTLLWQEQRRTLRHATAM